MEIKTLRYTKTNGVAVVTLNRPKVLNAMNRKMWDDLQRVLEDSKNDPQIRVVVVTGNGRAFSTGADLKESKNRSHEQYRAYLESVQDVSRTIIRYPKPTIAAINGYALGSGYELALACDIRLAAQEAQIGSPEARVSSSLTGGAFRLIQDLIGPGKAKELLFTAESIDGCEAERIGLVNKAVPVGQLMEQTLKLAEKIAENDLFSLKMIKKGLRMAQSEVSLEALMDFEIEACLACVSTKTRIKALDQFEKRKS
jgi:enoyl-CoA hydratase